jgi:hypothetical protein
MTWSVFYIGRSGEGFSETCPDWASAREVCRGYIDMVPLKNTDETFHRELDLVQPERSFHATDGINQFAIEAVAITQQD